MSSHIYVYKKGENQRPDLGGGDSHLAVGLAEYGLVDRHHHPSRLLLLIALAAALVGGRRCQAWRRRQIRPKDEHTTNHYI